MRKQIKKAIATVLTATMIMSIALPAFEANEVNISNETVNEFEQALKIMNMMSK